MKLISNNGILPLRPHPASFPMQQYRTKLFAIPFFAILFFLFLSCSRTNEPQPAQILVTVSNECLCNVFLYTPEGLCLQSKIWDCGETKLLIFSIYYEGALTVKAEFNDRSASLSVTARYGKSTEAGIIF